MATVRAAAIEGDYEWLSEIDLDPDGAWLRMGTRNLGSRPWLVADSLRAAELELKHRLLDERFNEVFVAEPDAGQAGSETLSLVRDAVEVIDRRWQPEVSVGPEAAEQSQRHPLDQAGRSVQEDLCLLRPCSDGTWVLGAASLCFPSRWRLATKVGRGLNGVHEPVPGYATTLNSRVDSLMTRLAEAARSEKDAGAVSKVVWRRNWFIHPNGDLFQPDRPAADPVIGPQNCLDELFLRSERQTLRALPNSGWVLFTIRTQQATLAQAVAHPGFQESLGRYLSDADQALVSHRGVGPDQRALLLEVLA